MSPYSLVVEFFEFFVVIEKRVELPEACHLISPCPLSSDSACQKHLMGLKTHVPAIGAITLWASLGPCRR